MVKNIERKLYITVISCFLNTKYMWKVADTFNAGGSGIIKPLFVPLIWKNRV